MKTYIHTVPITHFIGGYWVLHLVSIPILLPSFLNLRWLTLGLCHFIFVLWWNEGMTNFVFFSKIFTSKECSAREILKKFNLTNSKPVSTLMEVEVKVSKHRGGDFVDSTIYKSLIESLRYLMCTMTDFFFGVELIRRYMKTPTITRSNATKNIFWYIKGTLNFGLFHSYLGDFKLKEYCHSDWVSDVDDRKSTTIVVVVVVVIIIIIIFIFGGYNIYFELNEIIHCDLVHLWSWICCRNFICLLCNLVEKFIEQC